RRKRGKKTPPIGGGRFLPPPAPAPPPVAAVAVLPGFAEGNDPPPQFLARLEVRHVLRGHVHALAGLRITAGARRTVVQGEAAEAGDLYATALDEGGTQRIEYSLYRL